jgi:hypothetical protein
MRQAFDGVGVRNRFCFGRVRHRHDSRRFAGTARCRIIAAKKPCLAARKKRATGLPWVRLKPISSS